MFFSCAPGIKTRLPDTAWSCAFRLGSIRPAARRVDSTLELTRLIGNHRVCISVTSTLQTSEEPTWQLNRNVPTEIGEDRPVVPGLPGWVADPAGDVPGAGRDRRDPADSGGELGSAGRTRGDR